MSAYTKELSIRWSDIDPNFHLRHTSYYDFGAQLRTEMLAQLGITLQAMQAQAFGPVLFREECIFRREIKYGDQVSINLQLTQLRNDFSRFSIQHEFIRQDGTLCAILHVDGAWMNTKIRKLAPPPQIGIDAINALPKADNFTWVK